MGCVRSKEADIQDKVIKTDLEPGLQLGRYVRDPTADNKQVSGSRRAPTGGGLTALEPPGSGGNKGIMEKEREK